MCPCATVSSGSTSDRVAWSPNRSGLPDQYSSAAVIEKALEWPVAAPRQRPTIFPGNPTQRPAPVLDDQDQSQRQPRFQYRGRIRAMRRAPPRRRLSEGRRESLAGGRCRSAAAGSSRRGGAPAGAPRSAPRRSGSSAPVSRPGPASSALHASGVVNVARYKGSRRIVSADREPGHGRGQSLPRPDRRERPARADGPAEHAPGVGVDRVQEPAVTA